MIYFRRRYFESFQLLSVLSVTDSFSISCVLPFVQFPSASDSSFVRSLLQDLNHVCWVLQSFEIGRTLVPPCVRFKLLWPITVLSLFIPNEPLGTLSLVGHSPGTGYVTRGIIRVSIVPIFFSFAKILKIIKFGKIIDLFQNTLQDFLKISWQYAFHNIFCKKKVYDQLQVV